MDQTALAISSFEPAYRQLKPMEKVFVDAYVADIEVAAEQTGERLLAILQRPLPPNLDERTRSLLARPMVRAAIADRVRELSDAMEVSNYRTLKSMMSLAYSSMGHYMTVDAYGEPSFNLTNCTPEQLEAIQYVEIEETTTGRRKFKFKLHDKFGPLKEMMQYQGLREPDNQHWRNANKTAAPLNVDATVSDAADAYAKMIKG